MVTIEKIFDLVGVYLRKDAIEKKIKKETYEHFCIRVPYPLYNFPLDIIVQVIASMARQIDAVIKVKGQRTKY